MFRKILLLVWGCLAWQATVLAQSQTVKPSLGFGLNAYLGYAVAHHPHLLAQEAHIWGLELVIGKQTAGTNEFEWAYKKPRYGLAIVYTDLGNEINGKCVGILPHFEFGLLNRPKTRLKIRMGTGIGIFTRPFDPVTNYKNKMIGSRVTGALQILAVFQQKIYKNLEGQICFGITHYSNGNTALPNFGVNMPNFTFGLNYWVEQKKKEAPLYQPVKFKGSNHYQVMFAPGFKQYNDVYPKTYFVATLSGAYMRRLGRKSKLGGGLDIFYDPTNYFADNRAAIGRPASFDKSVEVGVKAGYDLVIGKVNLVMQAGVYLYAPTGAHTITYQRVGVKYDFWKCLSAGVYLKTHQTVADYIEWGVGAHF